MIKNLLNLFFPEICFGCNELLTDNESIVCTTCRHGLPVTNYHFDQDKTVEKVFYGRVKLEKATSLLKFQKKGMVQQLLHNLKYKGYEQIGEFLGTWLGHELREVDAYNNIDLVIPVPLHSKKLRKRGFNQVAQFGKEIAKAIDADYADDILIKVSPTSTQVFKKRLARWDSNQDIFAAANFEKAKGKHILLVDDIITTGATIETCCNTLLEHTNLKISVATMAIA